MDKIPKKTMSITRKSNSCFHLFCRSPAVSLIKEQQQTVFVCKTIVRFAPLSPEQIQSYIDSGEPMDKAGAYGIQGKAAGFVEWIQGSYTNVVGLPLAQTLMTLDKFTENSIIYS